MYYYIGCTKAYYNTYIWDTFQNYHQPNNKISEENGPKIQHFKPTFEEKLEFFFNAAII
jgi:hypothetical protein